MGLRGMGAVKTLKKKMDDRRASFGAVFTPNFSLKDGEKVVVLFNGSQENEPYIVEEHNCTINREFRTETCAKEKAKKGKHDGCVPCHLVKEKDRRIGRPAQKAVYNVVDTRWVHKRKDRERSEGDRERFKYSPCSDKPSCVDCKKKIPREHSGQKKWTMSLTWALALDALNEQLQTRCMNCGGRTKVIGYLDTSDGETHTEPVEGREDEFEPMFKCLKCKKVKPRTIFDVPILVMRSGAMKSTSYQFSRAEDFEREPWMDKCEPVDLDAACSPRSSEQQAERLGVDNPFDGPPTKGKKGKGDTEEYEDEEEEGEEGEELFEEEEETEEEE